MNRGTVIQSMQIAFFEIYNALSFFIFYRGIFDIPFSRHSPVKDQGSSRDLMYGNRDLPGNNPERLSDAVAGDTAAYRIEFFGEAIHIVANTLNLDNTVK